MRPRCRWRSKLLTDEIDADGIVNDWKKEIKNENQVSRRQREKKLKSKSEMKMKRKLKMNMTKILTWRDGKRWLERAARLIDDNSKIAGVAECVCVGVANSATVTWVTVTWVTMRTRPERWAVTAKSCSRVCWAKCRRWWRMMNRWGRWRRQGQDVNRWWQ